MDQLPSEIEEYFAKHPIKKTSQNITQTIESILNKNAWQKRSLSDIFTWLKEWDKKH